MTPRELLALAAGYRWRRQRHLEIIAWQTAHLLRCWGADVQPADLLASTEPPDLATENAQFDALAGATPTEGASDAYERLLAAQRAKGLNRG